MVTLPDHAKAEILTTPTSGSRSPIASATRREHLRHHGEVFDLFAVLDADEEQLDFPVLFASAKHGWAATDSARTGEKIEVARFCRMKVGENR